MADVQKVRREEDMKITNYKSQITKGVAPPTNKEFQITMTEITRNDKKRITLTIMGYNIKKRSTMFDRV
jgi:hypothetical protein